MTSRRCREHLQEQRPRRGASVGLKMDVAKLHPQIGIVGRQRKPVLEHRDGLVEPSQPGEQCAAFEKCRWKRRPARGGATQLRERVFGAPGGGQRAGEKGFDDRIVAATCCLFQNNDRLAGTALHQQRAPEHLRREHAAAVRLQDAERQAFGFIRQPHLQREDRAVEIAMAAGTADSRRYDGAFRHRGDAVEIAVQPRPTNGILVAITVMNSTLASSGRPAM